MLKNNLVSIIIGACVASLVAWAFEGFAALTIKQHCLSFLKQLVIITIVVLVIKAMKKR